jgi:predicted ArsR family transcriptional regulator
MATKKTASKAPAAADGARDRFGNRVGTQAAVINAALTSKPQTAAQVAEATGLNAGRIASHFKWLLERGHVVKTDAGYAVKPAKKSSSKKPG